jgi:hypothetical protein
MFVGESPPEECNMPTVHDPEGWLNRVPRPGETCVFSHGGFNQHSHGNPMPHWKRDALLFDRIYIQCSDPNNPPDVPPELTFGIARVDQDVRSHINMAAQALVEIYHAERNPERFYTELKSGQHGS